MKKNIIEFPLTMNILLKNQIKDIDNQMEIVKNKRKNAKYIFYGWMAVFCSLR